jgi:hypothetical protein
MKFKLKQISPTVQIHSWGGLGSQLHALALHLYLSRKYTNRDFLIYFHSSGVTQRFPDPEICKLDIKTKFIDDYFISQNPRTIGNYSKYKTRLRGLIIQFLDRWGFSIRPNDLEEVVIRPWTFEIRGHYSKIKFPLPTYQLMATMLSLYDLIELQSQLAIHVRAGDLLELVDKNMTPISDLMNISQSEGFRNSRIVVFTESTNWLAKQLAAYSLRAKPKILGPEVAPLSLMRQCISAKQFIGTNSKLSLWISVFRILSGQHQTAIPGTLRLHFEALCPEGVKQNPVYY